MNAPQVYEMTIVFRPPAAGQLPKFSATPDPIEVEPGSHVIEVKLVTEDPEHPNETAAFSPRAIDWCDKEGFLTTTPPAFALAASPAQLSLLDFNYQGNAGTFKFIVYVTYQGVTYASPDPTIINKPWSEDP